MNINTRWANTFVESLAAQGLELACLAAGSRSTPLTYAFAQHRGIKAISFIDERSAGFYALGYGKAAGKPAAVVCTSGTAAANFFPAVIEASVSGVPTLALTADRPPELIGSGSNQSIDQIKLYGDFPRLFVQAALPEEELLQGYIQSLAGRAWLAATGINPGPVQINFPFRKPLEPEKEPGKLNGNQFESFRPYIRTAVGRITPTDEQVMRLMDTLQDKKQVWLVCGEVSETEYFPKAVTRLAERSGFPIFADAQSGARFSKNQNNGLLMGGYESFLKYGVELPEAVLQFGKLGTSKVLNDLMNRHMEIVRIQVNGSGEWQDDGFTSQEYYWADETLMADALTEAWKYEPVSSATFEALTEAEKITWETLDSFITEKPELESRVLIDLVNLLPDGSTLFTGNSLPVRHLDQFGRPMKKNIRVLANRGASGIDGVVSSALGAAMGLDDRVTLVIGDISFLHDMNGLLALKKAAHKITIIVINNDGGGIFERLPISDFEPTFTDFFLTPHGLNFKSAAEMYGLRYSYVESPAKFGEIYKAGIKNDENILIEVKSNAKKFEKDRQEFLSRLSEHIHKGARLNHG